jgi:hypothetical protein
MKKHSNVKRVAARAATAIALASLAGAATAGPTYKFTVTCFSKRFVMQWNTGDIDPGKEFLRISTGTKNPGCGVSDFNPSTDAKYPVEQVSGAPAVFEGIPLAGPLISRLLGF